MSEFGCKNCKCSFVPDENNILSETDSRYPGIAHQLTTCPICGTMIVRQTTRMVVPRVEDLVHQEFYRNRLKGMPPKDAWSAAKKVHAS